jgi:hypothetical protein
LQREQQTVLFFFYCWNAHFFSISFTVFFVDV